MIEEQRVVFDTFEGPYYNAFNYPGPALPGHAWRARAEWGCRTMSPKC